MSRTSIAQIGAVVLGALLLVLGGVPGLAAAAAPGSEGVQAATAATSPVEQARALMNAGALAQARAALTAGMGSLEGQTKASAQDLLARAEAKLVAFAKQVNEARAALETDAARRAQAEAQFDQQQNDKRSEADGLFKDDPSKAAELYRMLANERAAHALANAATHYDAGMYDQVEVMLIKIKAAVDGGNAELSPRDLKKLQSMIAGLAVARMNFDAGGYLIEQAAETPPAIQAATPSAEEVQQAHDYLAKAQESMAKQDAAGGSHFLVLALSGKGLTEEERTKAKDDLRRLEGEQQQKTARFVKQQGEAAEKGKLELSAAERAKIFWEQEQRRQEIYRQEQRAIADDHYSLALEHYRNANYKAAKAELDTALKHEPEHAEAKKLYDNVAWLLGESVSPAKAFFDNLTDVERVGYQAARVEMIEQLRQGERAQQEEKYDEAIGHYQQAQDLLTFLRPAFNVEGQETLLKDKLAEAQARKAAADRAAAIRRERESTTMALRQREMERRIDEQKVNELYNRAFDAFARRDYTNAIAMANNVLQIEPHSISARELRDRATEAQQKELWRNLEDEYMAVRKKELMLQKQRSMWIPEQYRYPSKEQWQEIINRGPVPLPSGAAMRTPDELKVEEALNVRVPLDFVYAPLRDVTEYLKTVTSIDINLDQEVMTTSERLVSVSMRDARLGEALKFLLLQASTPEEKAQLNSLDYMIYGNGIFISSRMNLQLLQRDRMDLRVYDIRDFMGVSRGTTSTTGTTTGTEGQLQTLTRADTMRMILMLITQVTGREYWGVVQDLNPGGEGGEAFGSEQGQLGPLPPDQPSMGQGSVFLYGSGDMVVLQTPEMHKKLEDLLTQLRGMVENQVYVDMRFLNFTDSFLEAFGVSAITGIVARTSRSILFPKSEIGLDLGGYGTPAHETTGIRASVAFLDYPGTQALLEAVKESKHASVMQAPAITLMNTDQSSIDLTTSYSYVASFEVGEGGVAVPTIDQVEDTVTLTVRPIISADRRYVLVEATPEFDTLDRFDEVNQTLVLPPLTEGGAERLLIQSIKTPVTSSKSLTARVRVPDRGTAILGGFTATSDTTREGGPPILMNLPLIKRLFSSKGYTRTRNHQVFVVSPTIILPSELEEKMPTAQQ